MKNHPHPAITRHPAASQLPRCVLALFALCIIALAGCSRLTADLTRYRTDICEIHGCQMNAKELKGLPGTSASLPDFASACAARFPHYDGPRWSGDHLFYHASKIRDFVCPQCTAAYNQWRAEHPETKL